jgi:hypothetical protein
MIDAETLTRARNEVIRLNRELADLHLEEERCKLMRGRLEAEKAKVQALVDMAELAQRLVNKPEYAGPPFHIETRDGVKFVVVDKPASAAQQQTAAPDRHKRKPDGLPAVSAMIVIALQETGKASRPVEIADFVRKRWWPTVSTTTISAQVWHMAKVGKLTSHDGYYGLNGVGH